MSDKWLGLERTADDAWRVPVTAALVSGASALFGGCATAIGLVVTRELSAHPVLWASTHFGSLAKLDSVVDVRARVIASGRTLTHVEVTGFVDDRESFTVRAAGGERPAGNAEGQWTSAPPVAAVDDATPFEHPVHQQTWASRFEWRLAGSERGQFSAWWVRPLDVEADPLVVAPVLVDYVTYGIGRALGVPMGGLSVDNVVRLHRLAAAEWYLLEVRPEAINGGFGFGAARLFADGVLVASGTQTIVVNTWDWRLPAERDG